MDGSKCRFLTVSGFAIIAILYLLQYRRAEELLKKNIRLERELSLAQQHQADRSTVPDLLEERAGSSVPSSTAELAALRKKVLELSASEHEANLRLANAERSREESKFPMSEADTAQVQRISELAKLASALNNASQRKKLSQQEIDASVDALIMSAAPGSDDRYVALKLLGGLQFDVDRVLPSIIDGITDDSQMVRNAARQSARRLGSCAAPYLEEALKGLNGPAADRVRESLGEVLSQEASKLRQ